MNEDRKHLLIGDAGSSAEAARLLAEHIREESAERFRNKLRTTKIVTWAFLAFDVVGMIAAANVWARVSDVRYMVAAAVLFLLFFEGTSLIKLWYWVVHTRVTLQHEMKELQLQVSQTLTAVERLTNEVKAQRAAD
jgi:hypothetical protein